MPNIQDILKNIHSLSPDERTQVADALNAASAGNSATIRASASLENVATAFMATRVKLTPIQAAMASPGNYPEVLACKRMASRMGYDLKENEQVNLHALDKAIKDKDPQDRMYLKSRMRQFGLL